MRQREYTINTPKIILGKGEFSNIGKYIQELKSKKVLVIIGKKSMKEFEYLDKLLNYLKDYQIFVFGGISPNPSIEITDKAIQYAREKEIDLIIGLGGGSVLDVSKLVSVLLKNKGVTNDYLYRERKILNKGIPLIAIPTITGSGTEVTKSAVVTDYKNKYKYSISHEYLRPEIAIIDEDFCLTVPKEIAISSKIDIISHSIEGYLCKDNSFSKIMSIQALKSFFLGSFSEASLFGAMSFSNSGTLSPHSFSYILTTHYNIPHGIATIISLPSFIKLWSLHTPKVNILAKSLNLTVDKLIKKINNITKELGIKTRLRDYKIPFEKKKFIASEALKINKQRDPLKIDLQILEKICDEIW